MTTPTSAYIVGIVPTRSAPVLALLALSLLAWLVWLLVAYARCCCCCCWGRGGRLAARRAARGATPGRRTLRTVAACVAVSLALHGVGGACYAMARSEPRLASSLLAALDVVHGRLVDVAAAADGTRVHAAAAAAALADAALAVPPSSPSNIAWIGNAEALANDVTSTAAAAAGAADLTAKLADAVGSAKTVTSRYARAADGGRLAATFTLLGVLALALVGLALAVTCGAPTAAAVAIGVALTSSLLVAIVATVLYVAASVGRDACAHAEVAVLAAASSLGGGGGGGGGSRIGALVTWIVHGERAAAPVAGTPTYDPVLALAGVDVVTALNNAVAAVDALVASAPPEGAGVAAAAVALASAAASVVALSAATATTALGAAYTAVKTLACCIVVAAAGDE